MTEKEALEEAISCVSIVKDDRCCTESEEQYMDDVIRALEGISQKIGDL